MIVNSERVRTAAVPVPEYLATSAEDEIVGAGQESIQLFQNWLSVFDYVTALATGCVANPSTDMPRAESFGYSETLRQVHELSSLPQEDEFGKLRPSAHAIRETGKIVARMLQSGVGVPVPEDVSTDREGDLRIAWENSGRTLEVVCPYDGDRRPYVYYSDDHDHDIAYDMSTYRVGRLLAWLTSLGSAFPR